MINVAIDFDDTIHLHHEGSGGNVIPGKPAPGSMERLVKMFHHGGIDKIYIFSLRCYGGHGIAAMSDWIYHHLIPVCGEEYASYIRASLIFTFMKPDKCVIIDDRCIQFRGDWSDPTLSVDAIANFRAWNRV
jgi:hypothetical protein